MSQLFLNRLSPTFTDKRTIQKFIIKCPAVPKQARGISIKQNTPHGMRNEQTQRKGLAEEDKRGLSLGKNCALFPEGGRARYDTHPEY